MGGRSTFFFIGIMRIISDELPTQHSGTFKKKKKKFNAVALAQTMLSLIATDFYK